MYGADRRRKDCISAVIALRTIEADHTNSAVRARPRFTRKMSGRMKTLMTLSVLQTIGLAVLIIQLFGNGRQSAPERQAQNAGAATSPQSMHAPDGDALFADEKRLRNIVREELARLQVPPNTPSSASPARRVHARDEPTHLQQQQLIAQQIETYRAVGAITDEQMQELQVDIAQLDEESRREMMSRLIRALNSGELKGRL